MNRKNWLLWLGASAAALTAGMPGAAIAQEGKDIVVTATRRAENLQNVPMAVNVATGEQLEDLNLLDTKDISQLAPGLSLTNSTGRNNTTTIRGIGFDPDQGTDPAVQIYWNEVPTDAQTVFTSLYDIQQIEVLRGPQGLLRGLSSPGGAITIATRRPKIGATTPEGRIQATGTDRGTWNVQGGVTVPMSDVFSLRVAGLIEENRGNQVRNVTNGDRSEASTESARVTLGFQPNDNFEAYLTYQYLTSDNAQYQQVFGPGATPDGVNRSGPAAGIKDRIAVADGPTLFKNESHFFNLNTDWNLGPATLSAVASYQYTKLDQTRDLDPGNAAPGYNHAQSVETPYKIPNIEVRLTSNDDGMFGWGVGAFYRKQTGDVIVNQKADSFFFAAPVAAGFFLPIDTNVFVPIDSTTWSFNANGRFHSGPFTAEGGIRYSILESTRVSDITATSPGYAGFPFFGIPAIPAFTQLIDGIPAGLKEQKDKPITGGLTLSYEINPDMTAYASYGHSFRQGSVGVAVPAGLSNDLIATDNEKTDAFEVGLKGYALDRRVNYELAVFHQKFDGFLSRFTGIQYNCPDFFGSCTPFGAPINNATDAPNGSFDFNYNGDAKVQGVELTLSTRPTDFWDLSVNMAYAHARFDKEGRFPCNDFNGDGVPDSTGTPRITGTGNVSFCSAKRLADVPDFSMTANSEVRLPPVLNSEVTPFLRGLVSYRPGVTSELNAFKYDAQTLVNLYAGLRGETSGWEATLFAKNVFDQSKITNISSGNATEGPFDSGYRLINSTVPREIGVTLSYAFGG